jgi:hypothetical protein
MRANTAAQAGARETAVLCKHQSARAWLRTYAAASGAP